MARYGRNGTNYQIAFFCIKTLYCIFKFYWDMTGSVPFIYYFSLYISDQLSILAQKRKSVPICIDPTISREEC